MASNRFTFRAGAELPNLQVVWQEETAQNTWTDLDLSSGYTFTVTLVDTNGTTQLTKTSGITGNTDGLTIDWAVDDLDVPVGRYDLHIRAREVSTTHDRDYSPDQPVQIIIV